MPHQQRRAKRAACVAGGRLNPETFERPFAQQAAIGDAVQGDAAGHHEIALRR